MGLSERLPKERWRRLGTLNVSLIISCGLILTICLLSFTLSRPGSTITEAKILFQGKCSTSNSLDLFLQFTINIFSTCVLASSNFFMQIVSSPTRKEIDHAHRSLHSLEIGVSSFKNLGALSWFKILAWAGLFLTSVPIHILFNSAIYPIDYQGSEWHLTIATPGFVDQTVDYFVPGASLAAVSSCPDRPNGTNLYCNYSEISINAGGDQDILTKAGAYGFGQHDSPENVTRAAQNSASWKFLAPSDCFDQFKFCRPRQEYRDLVVVVDKVPGWTRSEVYNFSGSSASNLSQFWDPRIPPDSLNSLWYSASCQVGRYGSSWANGNRVPKICGSSLPRNDYGCGGALGEPSGVDWIATTKLQGSWTIPFRPANMTVPPDFGYDAKFSELPVKHCMAEPNPDYTCKLGLAPPLLLIVIGCVFIKGGICAGILLRLTDNSLVTPGDAISSFICQPDSNTIGLGTMGFIDADRLEYDGIEKIPASGLFHGPVARRWKHCPRRFKSVLSRAVWVRTYSVLIAGMALISTGLGLDVSGYGAATL